MEQELKEMLPAIPIVTRTRNLDDLRERTKPFISRVKLSELVDWVDVVDIVNVEMTPRQKTLYKQISRDVLLKLESGDLKVVNALSDMTRCLQVAEGVYNIEPKWQDSGKLDYLREDFRNSTDKVCGWFRFKAGTEILYKEFKGEAVIFNGDYTQNQKTLALWAFQGVSNEQDEAEYKRLAAACKFRFKPGEARILLGVIDKSTTLGFNLPACNRQLFPSFAWNGNVNRQTGDRIKRINQEADSVYTTYLVSEGTIEERALEMIFANYRNCAHVLDGKDSLDYNKTQELIKLLRRTV